MNEKVCVTCVILTFVRAVKLHTSGAIPYGGTGKIKMPGQGYFYFTAYHASVPKQTYLESFQDRFVFMASTGNRESNAALRKLSGGQFLAVGVIVQTNKA